MSSSPSVVAAAVVPPLDVLTFGEAMVLFMAETPGPLAEVERWCKATAGAELNVAIGLSRLGLRAGLITAVGQDSLGDYLRQAMREEGLDTGLVQVDASRPTGLMFKTRVHDGSDPAIEYRRKGSAASAMGVDALPFDGFPARHLHLTGIAPALSPQNLELVLALAQRARAAGATLSFDPNLRPQLWPSRAAMVETVNAIAALCDIVLPGVAEGEILTGSADPRAIADFYLAQGASRVVVKLGREGAYCQGVAPDEQAGCRAPGVAVARVVDTVGAGDGFAVGIISGLLDGLTMAESAQRGNQIAARVIQFAGDATGLPTRAELAQGPCNVGG